LLYLRNESKYKNKKYFKAIIQTKHIETELDIFFYLLLIYALSYLSYSYSVLEFDMNSVKHLLRIMAGTRQKKKMNKIVSSFITGKKDIWIINSNARQKEEILLSGKGNMLLKGTFIFCLVGFLSRPIKNHKFRKIFPKDQL